MPVGADITVCHEFPTVRWQVLGEGDPTPAPRFYNAGDEFKMQATAHEYREYVWEVLQEPKYTEEEVRHLIDSARYSVKVGNKPMLENKYLRMWDLRLPPGGGDPSIVHQHVLDNSFILLDACTAYAYTPRSDNRGTQYRRTLRFKPGQVIWTEVPRGGFDADGQPVMGDCVHGIANGSRTNEFREYYIELK